MAGWITLSELSIDTYLPEPHFPESHSLDAVERSQIVRFAISPVATSRSTPRRSFVMCWRCVN